MHEEVWRRLFYRFCFLILKSQICKMVGYILIVAATDLEAEAFKRVEGLNINTEILVTGIGAVATAYMLTKRLSKGPRPSLVINIGIAGSYSDNIHIGDVTVPVSDCFGDAGVESDKGFMTLFEAGLLDGSSSPFTGGLIMADKSLLKSIDKYSRSIATPGISKSGDKEPVKLVNAITLNSGSASADTINFVRNKFNPDIETMEGASFFYICTLEKVPFVAIRGISNKVGSRDKKLWDIPLAINNLSVFLKELILSLS